MNYLKTGILMAVTGVMLSCGGKHEETKSHNESGNTLSGKWEIVKAEGMMSESNVGTQYIFEEGSLTFSKDGFDNKAKSNHTDSTFTWENANMTMEYSYKFAGNQLVAKPMGSDQILYLERK